MSEFQDAAKILSALHSLRAERDKLGEACDVFRARIVDLEKERDALHIDRAAMMRQAAADSDTIRQLREERDAYKRAKGENDDRFMTERDEARAELAKVTADLESMRAIHEPLLIQRDRFSGQCDVLDADLRAARATTEQHEKALETANARVAMLAGHIEQIAREEEAADLSKYDCPSAQLRWAIENADAALTATATDVDKWLEERIRIERAHAQAEMTPISDLKLVHLGVLAAHDEEVSAKARAEALEAAARVVAEHPGDHDGRPTQTALADAVRALAREPKR